MLWKVLKWAALYYAAAMGLYLVVRQVFPDPIIFYQGLAIIAFATLGFSTAITIACLVSRISITQRDMQLTAILIAALSLYGTHVTVPSLLDRSISLYLIGLTHEGGAKTLPEYRDLFYRGFIVRNGAIEKRLHEQVRSGNITEVSGTYTLSRRGAMIYHLNQMLAKIFNTDVRYVAPGMGNDPDKPSSGKKQ